MAPAASASPMSLDWSGFDSPFQTAEAEGEAEWGTLAPGPVAEQQAAPASPAPVRTFDARNAGDWLRRVDAAVRTRFGLTGAGLAGRVRFVDRAGFAASFPARYIEELLVREFFVPTFVMAGTSLNSILRHHHQSDWLENLRDDKALQRRRTQLGAFVRERVRAGNFIYDKTFGEKTITPRELIADVIGGFTTSEAKRADRRVLVQTDQPVELLVHEACHFYADPRFNAAVARRAADRFFIGVPLIEILREGMAEAFSRQVMRASEAAFGALELRAYEPYVRAAGRFVETLGERDARAAYFAGDTAAIDRLFKAVDLNADAYPLLVPSFMLDKESAEPGDRAREESEEEAGRVSGEGQLERGESYESAADGGRRWTDEALAWLDVEAPGLTTDWTEAAVGEAEWPEAEEFQEPEAGWTRIGAACETLETHGESEAAGGSAPVDRGESGASAAQLSALEALVESEAGVGTVLAQRIGAAAGLVIGPTLRHGSNGPAVAALQRSLARLGAMLAADGDFGPSTEQAVKAFQKRSGLIADGAVGPRTKAALAGALARGGAAQPASAATSTPPLTAPAATSKAQGATSTAAKFVAAYGAAARASEAANGVPALVTLGQAALESGWGRHAPRFNFFGIKARGSDPEATRQLLRTREVFSDRNRKFPEIISITPRADGKFDYIVKDWFRAFPDAASGFKGHGEFLVRNKRYARAFTLAADPYAFAAEVARAGYATDPNYARVLMGVMRTIEAAGGP
jgi:flagellum-specific peptidoglycan hydrolase FlgJ